MAIPLFLLLFLPNQVLSDSFAPKIVGGEKANNEFLYQVHISDGFNLRCSGTILNEYWVLTHSACVTPSTSFYVISGTLSSKPAHGSQHAIVESLKHDLNNITLVRVKTPIELNDLVRPITLPENDSLEGLDCVFSGWGKMDSLQYINVSTMSNEECRERLPYDQIMDTVLCSENEEGCGACFGDLGGPLIVGTKTQIGLLNNIHSCTLGDPDIFIRIYRYLSWIKENIDIK